MNDVEKYILQRKGKIAWDHCNDSPVAFNIILKNTMDMIKQQNKETIRTCLKLRIPSMSFYSGGPGTKLQVIFDPTRLPQ